MKSQSQKTFLMLEHALWQTVLKIQTAMGKIEKNLSRTCLTEPKTDYFRTNTFFPDVAEPKYQVIDIWNSYVGLKFEVEIGNDTEAQTLTAFYRIPGKLGGHFCSTQPGLKVQNFRDVFTGALPLTEALPKEQHDDLGEMEAVVMLWNYVKEGIFGGLHDQHAKSPEDFLKLVECVYNRDYFDILSQDSRSLTVGNDLVRVLFTKQGEASVNVCVEYRLADRHVHILGTMDNVSEHYFIHPFCYTIRPLLAHLSQE